MNRLSNRTAWLLIAAGVVLIVAGLGAIVAILVGGDDDDGGALAASGIEVAESGGDEPVVDQPAGAYTILFEDLRLPFTVNHDLTYDIPAEGYTFVPYFGANEDAKTLLSSWGFTGGYISTYDPVGLVAGLLEGRHYLRVEVYRFEGVNGARQAFDQFARFHLQRDGIEPVEADPVGNESVTFALPAQPIEGSDTQAVFERTIFRRGNLVAIVQTAGAEDVMQSGLSAFYAVGIDLKATGEEEAVTPTPTGQQDPNQPGPRVDPSSVPPVFETTPTPAG